MPVVTVDTSQFDKVDLKSAPPDGYVMLRPLPFGLKLSRRSKATKMMMKAQPVQSRKQAQEQEQVFELESLDEWAVAFDFQYCIGEHNLQNSDGNLLDFAKNPHMAIKNLDPKVGAEIEKAIDKLNNDEDEESLEDFLQRSSTLSEIKPDTLSEDGLEIPIQTA